MTKTTNYLDFVTSEIGGSGKSFYSKVLAHFFGIKCLKYIVVDADESTPNVGRAYNKPNYDLILIGSHAERLAKGTKDLLVYQTAVEDAKLLLRKASDFSLLAEDDHNRDSLSQEKIDIADLALADKEAAEAKLKIAEDNLALKTKELIPPKLLPSICFVSKEADDFTSPDKLLDIAFDYPNTIVNLPAQVSASVNRWMKRSSLLDEVKKDGVLTTFWFVARPTHAAMEILESIWNFHDRKLQIVLVKNHHEQAGALKWADFDKDPRVSKFLSEAKFPIVNMPDLTFCKADADLFNDQYLTFDELMEQASRGGKYRTKAFLREIGESIDATKIFDDRMPDDDPLADPRF
jgi:hypothetical protein